MDWKEVVGLCMESPLYFSMPLAKRLEFVKGGIAGNPTHGLREDLLSWVKTGRFSLSDQ